MKQCLCFILILFCSCGFISCKLSENYCDKSVSSTLPNGGSIGFMSEGGILDKYDEGKVYISIAKVNDPKDWSYNEYFTGEGFSPNEEDKMKVLEQDSCEIKQAYFEYLKDQK